MKKTKFLKILLSFLLIALIAINVYATDETTGTESTATETEEWTDFSKVTATLVSEPTTSNYKEYYIKITGVTLQNTRTYRMFITHSETQPTLLTDDKQSFVEEALDIDKEKNISLNINNEYTVQKFIEENGDLYCWIVEGKFTENGITTGEVFKTKLERPELNAIGQRIQCYFFNDKTSTFLFEANTAENRKINLKIGTVTDNDILLSIKNKEPDCLQKLMNYSKSAKSIYTGTVPLGESDSITSNMNLVDQAYYYVYMSLDDEDGKYYSVEDVSLYQAIVTENVGKNLFDYLYGNFKWNLSDSVDTENSDNSGKTDTTVSTKILPDTGITTIIVLIFGMLIINTIIGVHKYNKFKDIK